MWFYVYFQHEWNNTFKKWMYFSQLDHWWKNFSKKYGLHQKLWKKSHSAFLLSKTVIWPRLPLCFVLPSPPDRWRRVCRRCCVCEGCHILGGVSKWRSAWSRPFELSQCGISVQQGPSVDILWLDLRTQPSSGFILQNKDVFVSHIAKIQVDDFIWC